MRDIFPVGYQIYVDYNQMITAVAHLSAAPLQGAGDAVKSRGEDLMHIAHSPLFIVHFRHILTQQTNGSTRQANTMLLKVQHFLLK